METKFGVAILNEVGNSRVMRERLATSYDQNYKNNPLKAEKAAFLNLRIRANRNELTPFEKGSSDNDPNKVKEYIKSYLPTLNEKIRTNK